MRYLSALFFTIAASSAAYAWDQRPPLNPTACAIHTPYGQPEVTKADTTLICRQGYFTLHDNQAKIPVWTAWYVAPNTVNGCIPRTNAFVADQSLPQGKRAAPADYARSGYDQGHLANDAHQSYDLMVEYESFLLSNMSPQAPSINRGIWKLLETATGSWVVERKHTLVVYAGNIYGASNKTIGANKVVVPHGLFKIVIDKDAKEYAAWVFPNEGNMGNDLTKARSTVAQVTALTGIKFHFPDKARELGPMEQWPLDYGALTASKKAACPK